MSGAAFLGVGWAFPIVTDADGEVALSRAERSVREAVHIILATNPGERVMRPDFGAGLAALAFEPIGATTAALVRHRVEDALVRFEPRIDVLDVRVTPAVATANRLDIELDYRVRATNTFYNLVYPFYLLEGRPT